MTVEIIGSGCGLQAVEPSDLMNQQHTGSAAVPVVRACGMKAVAVTKKVSISVTLAH